MGQVAMGYGVGFSDLSGAFDYFNTSSESLETPSVGLDHSNGNIAGLAYVDISNRTSLAGVSPFDDLTQVAFPDIQSFP
jgi:hypothetical protein